MDYLSRIVFILTLMLLAKGTPAPRPAPSVEIEALCRPFIYLSLSLQAGPSRPAS